MERKQGDYYFGLGDKTGPLNLHGRRLRCDMTDALGYNPESGDPLYKNWPFLLTKDATTGENRSLREETGKCGILDHRLEPFHRC
jgi:alpha-glucosidase